jgi:predicted nucleic acid-binding protein
MAGDAEAFMDTNVLVYAIDSNSRFYGNARHLLDSTDRIYAVAPQIVFAFLSAVTNVKRVRSPLTTAQAHNALGLILARPNLQLFPIDSQALGKALSLVAKHNLTGPRVFDALVAGIMLRHRIPVIITANVKHFQSLGLATEPL